MAGLPGITAPSTYGSVAFTNFAPVEDETTDLDAAKYVQLIADASAMSHTACRAWVRFTGTTYTSGTMTMTVVAHDSMWGSTNAVKPVVTETAAGVYTVTWAATQTDQLGATQTLNLREVESVKFTGSTPRLWTEYALTANTVTVKVFDVAGAANAANGQDITIRLQ